VQRFYGTVPNSAIIFLFQKKQSSSFDTKKILDVLFSFCHMVFGNYYYRFNGIQ